MIYLSGVVRPNLFGSDIGVMLQPAMGNKVDLARTTWAADTGCYAQGERFDLGRYLDWLAQRQAYTGTCLFATAPDVVGNAEATLERSLPVLPAIRAMGFRAALVAQDGLTPDTVPWDAIDCLFVGGTTTYKLSESAYALATEAKARRKWIHMGRVNSWRRLRAAAVAGYDSADGTYLKFGPDVLLPRLERWISQLGKQTVLEFPPEALR